MGLWLGSGLGWQNCLGTIVTLCQGMWCQFRESLSLFPKIHTFMLFAFSPTERGLPSPHIVGMDWHTNFAGYINAHTVTRKHTAGLLCSTLPT